MSNGGDVSTAGHLPGPGPGAPPPPAAQTDKPSATSATGPQLDLIFQLESELARTRCSMNPQAAPLVCIGAGEASRGWTIHGSGRKLKMLCRDPTLA